MLFRLLIHGCTPEGGLTPRALKGTWLVKTVNGNEDFNNWTWEFSGDNEFEYCIAGICYPGTYEWNEAEDEINTTYDSGNGNLVSNTFQVDVLDRTNLTGSQESDLGTLELVFERQ